MHRCFTLFLACFACCILLWCQCLFETRAFAEPPMTVRVGMYENHPKIFTGPDGTPQGFWPELLDHIARQNNWRIRYVAGTWRQGLERMLNNEIDMMPDVAYTDARKERFEFSRHPVIVSWSRIYVHGKNSSIRAVTDLSGKTVAVLQDSVNYTGPGGFRDLARGFNLGCTFLELPSYPEVFRAIENGTAHAGLTNRDFGRKNKEKYSVRQTPIVFQPINIRFAFPKSGKHTPVVLPAVDRAMERLQQEPDSLYYSLLARHLETGVAEKVVEVWPSWFSLSLKIAGAVCLILVLTLLVSRRQVRVKTRELREKNQDLSEKNSFIESLVHLSPDILYIYDIIDRKNLFTNQGIERTLGYTPNEIKGMGDRLLATLMHPDDFDRYLEKVIPRYNSAGDDDLLSQQFRMKHKDGSWCWLDCVEKIYSRTDDNRPRQIFGVIRDITEDVRARERNRQLRTQLHHARKMEAMGTLAGGIAHDFNNILAGILGYSQLAEQSARDPQKVTEHIGQVLKGVQRAADLVKRILTFSRQSEVDKTPVRLEPVVRDTLKLLRSTIPTSIDIREDLCSKGTVLADATQVNQVIMNLCANASHAMEERGGTLAISLADVSISDPEDVGTRGFNAATPLHPGDFVRLEIADTGHGMDPDVLEKAFDPYFTTKSPDKGTGLGLSLVTAIVEDHGGSLLAQSRPDRGTRFTIHFPQTVPAPADAPAPVVSDRPVTGNERILFVDDEAAIRKSSSEHLRGLGYWVANFEDGASALAAFEAAPDGYDLVITDMTMPGMTGDRLAQKILDLRPDMPVILCTGYTDRMSKEAARNMGIRNFLLKPVRHNDLSRLIREIFDSGDDQAAPHAPANK